MRSQCCHHRRGLTIGELVFVLALAVILGALLFPSIGARRDSAPRQKTATIVRNAVNAANQYKADYGYYPKIAAALGGTEDNSYYSYGDQAEGRCKLSNRALFDVLRAIDRGENAGHVLNPKQVKYFESSKAHDSKTPRDGFLDGPEFAPERQGQLLDPWGTEYGIILETDKNEELDLGAFYADLAGKEERIRFGAVGFSLGKDGKLGGPGYGGRFRKEQSTEAPDDVVSWQ